ncbi:MAG: aminotransferase class III-fold pyridoxal phosphate-dependent enzyme [Myxococcota bacterium]
MATPPKRPEVRTEIPGPEARALIERGRFDMQSIYRTILVDDAASEGVWIRDVDGNWLLDLFSSFALGALGYNHPALVEVARSPAFARAAANATSTPFVTAPAWIAYVEALQKRYAPPGAARVFCVDGGGEGVEAALKAAFIVHGERRRLAAGEPKNPLEMPEAYLRAVMDNAGTDAICVSFGGAFHGRGFGSMTATHSKPVHKADVPAFRWPTAPFPAGRWPLRDHAEHNAAVEAECLAELERILDANAGRVAAVLVEPVQSEGGDRHASAAFFRGVQRLTKAAGAALVLDEVQTGCGISGTLWCHEQFDLPVPPDLVCFGKKMQMGGFFATADYDIRQFGRMYHTRNGDRARALLGEATLREIVDGGLLANVRETGALFLAGLEDLAKRHPALVTEPRGRGFLLAFDLPTPALRDDFLKRSMSRGVFASYTGTRSVRLRPHLITGPAEVEIALAAFDASLRDMS